MGTILGTKVKTYGGGYALNQFCYVSKVLDKFKHSYDKRGKYFSWYSCEPIEYPRRTMVQLEYVSVVYCTRSDTTYIVCKLSRFMRNHGKRQLLNYLDT